MSEATLARHAVLLADLDARLTRLSGDVEDLASLTEAEPLTTDPEAAADDGPLPFIFTSVEKWVEGYLLRVFQRPFGGELRWCSRWHEHREAALRLEAMWRAWETLRVDPGLGLSVWLLNHFDPDFAVLTSRVGPFARCTTDRHVG